MQFLRNPMLEEGSKIQLLYQAAQALSGASSSPSTTSAADDSGVNHHQQQTQSSSSSSSSTTSQQQTIPTSSSLSNLLLNVNGANNGNGNNNVGNMLAAALQQSQQLQQLQIPQQSLILQCQQLSDLMRNQLSSLQERWHLNLLHQSQLIQQLAQCKDKKVSGQLQLQYQQLTLEQQQLVQQIQMQSRHYLLQQGLTSSGVSPTDLQRVWQDLMSNTGSSPSSDKIGSVMRNGGLMGNTATSLLDAVTSQQRLFGQTPLAELTLSHLTAAINCQPNHPLYQHGVCVWPSCETPCDSYVSFIHHLNAVHKLDDRSTAQCRVQMQVVEQLEAQLNKERLRLQSMMQHLQMKASPDTTTPGNGYLNSDWKDSPMISPKSTVSPSGDGQGGSYSPVSSHGNIGLNVNSMLNQRRSTSPIPSNMHHNSTLMSVSNGTNSQNVNSANNSATVMSSPTQSQRSASPGGFASSAPNATQPIRRRVSDKSLLPIAAEIARNREFYRTHDVRPLYTYASLIRQAIMESKDKQLTLNEIYNWFQDTFAYFRRNAATWKNAVRHNLSLHKCFTRVENVKGAVWTVDEAEFYKRRPQRLSNASLYSSSTSVDGQRSDSPFGSTSLGGICSDVVNSVLESASRLESTEDNVDDSFKYKFSGEMEEPYDDDVVDDDSKIGISSSFEKNPYSVESATLPISANYQEDVKSERIMRTTTNVNKSASNGNFRRPNSVDVGPSDGGGSDSDEPGNLTIDIDSVVVERKHETQPLNLSVTLNNS